LPFLYYNSSSLFYFYAHIFRVGKVFSAGDYLPRLFSSSSSSREQARVAAHASEMSEKLPPPTSNGEESPADLSEKPIIPARSSIDTITDSETARENARHGNPNGFVRTSSGVDVKAAEEEFAHLQRELSGISQISRKLSRSQSRQSKAGKGGEKDVERVGTSESTTEGEQFDLEHTLRGNHTVSFVRHFN
jgi:hypothetical protein